MENLETEVTENKKKKVKKAPVSVEEQGPKLKTKITVDFKNDIDDLERLNQLIDKANDKKFGRKVEVLDLLLCGLKKVDESDIESIQENTYSKMDKIHLAHESYNMNNDTEIDFEDFLIRGLNIQ